MKRWLKVGKVGVDIHSKVSVYLCRNLENMVGYFSGFYKIRVKFKVFTKTFIYILQRNIYTH